MVLAVPYAFLGAAMTAVWLRGTANDIYFQIGLLVLIGLTAKNAILIVEYAEQKMEEDGKGPFDAAIEAAGLRLRPILMTSLAFILGVTPMLLATGAGSAARHSMVQVFSAACLLQPLFQPSSCRSSSLGLRRSARQSDDLLLRTVEKARNRLTIPGFLWISFEYEDYFLKKFFICSKLPSVLGLCFSAFLQRSIELTQQILCLLERFTGVSVSTWM